MNSTEEAGAVGDLWVVGLKVFGVEGDGRRLVGFMVEVVKIRAPPRQRHDIDKVWCSRFCGGVLTVHFYDGETVHV